MGFYVVSDDKCFYEGMTKEQILTAITQAISTHQISDVDTGFVTTLKEANQNKPMSFWVGTTAEYNAIAEKLEDCVYLLTDDTELEDLEALIRRSMNVLKGEVLLDGLVPFQASGLHVALTGDHDIWEFTIVEVIDAQDCHTLCSVRPFLSQGEPIGAIIEGCAPTEMFAGSDASDPTLVYRNIAIRALNNNNPDGIVEITSNRSTQYVVNDPQGSAHNQGLTISKIIGVM